jgi:hypothetical protein
MRTTLIILSIMFTLGCDSSGGADGSSGKNGSAGAQGSKGDKGDPGPQGERGPQGPPGAGFPQWVLRDKNGDKVEGAFSPVSLPARKSPNYDRLPFGVFPEIETPCFIVSELEGERWPPMQYNIQNGRLLESCNEITLDSREYKLFLDNSCQDGPVQFLQENSNDRQGSWQGISFNGNYLVFEGLPDSMLAADGKIYWYYQGECREYPRQAVQIPIWRTKPMPAKYINAFPDGPYTLEQEMP